MPIPEIEILTNFVSRIFHVEDVTLGDPSRGLIARYRGHLIGDDSEAAYDQLAESLKPYEITPLFRRDKDQQVVFLVPRKPDPKPARASINIVLFILTVISVMMAGVDVPSSLCNDQKGAMLYIVKNILSGWPFALSLLTILVAHEFGHYLMSRYHKTPATLPYFIPFPFTPLGTMGAAILMQGTPKNKRVLFDIGVAGPLAGMVMAIPILFYGLSISPLKPIALSQCGLSLEGNSLFYLFAKFLVFGKFLPTPVGGQSLLYWIRYFFTGNPIPLGGVDVFVSPIAFAGWAGLLVTSLNLIPAGTLDGGHVVYSLFGDKAAKAFPYIFVALLILGIFWNGWWIWALLLLWLGRVHAEPLDQITPLDPTRRWIAILVILILLLTFSPVPFTEIIGV